MKISKSRFDAGTQVCLFLSSASTVLLDGWPGQLFAWGFYALFRREWTAVFGLVGWGMDE